MYRSRRPTTGNGYLEALTFLKVQVILGTVEAFTKKGIRTSSGNKKPDVDTKVLVIKFNK
jgi:hypothetical protein